MKNLDETATHFLIQYICVSCIYVNVCIDSHPIQPKPMPDLIRSDVKQTQLCRVMPSSPQQRQPRLHHPRLCIVWVVVVIVAIRKQNEEGEVAPEIVGRTGPGRIESREEAVPGP